MTYAATFENVSKTYSPSLWGTGKVVAVREVSLQVPAGSVFALLGPNRAGKTTLIKLLLSLARPTGGRVERLGQPISDRRTLGAVGYMHENHAFPRYLSAAEVLTFYGGIAGISTEQLPGKVEALLARVGLSDRTREPITQFSKGMIQRLGLAQAIINDPDLLVLDEPTEGLDLAGRKLLREVVRERKSAGKTVLLVSHVLPEVEELADHAAVILGGQIQYQGTLAALKGSGTLESALVPLYEKGGAA